VSASVDFVEVDQVSVGAPRPCFRGAIDLIGKHRDRHRQRNLGGLLRGREEDALAAGLPLEPRRRGSAVRQPVPRDVVQEIVFGEQALGLAVVVVVHEGRKSRW
jgi:hypothetical protein